MKKNKIEPPFEKGQFVKKTNNGLFNVSYEMHNKWTPHKRKYLPVIEIGTGRYIQAQKYWLLNGKFQFKNLDEIEIISKEEAGKLINFYYSLKLSEPLNKTIEETCYTSYTGERQEKRKFKTFNELRPSFYQFSINRPEDKFIAYKCPNCGFYHIGRQSE